MKKLLVFIFAFILLASCAKKKITAPEEAAKKEAAGKPTQEEVISEEVSSIRSEILTEGETQAPEQKVKEIFQDIYFEYDKFFITDEAKPVLREIANWMIVNTSSQIIIEGHCDERGTNEYNLALGDQRARASKNYLVSLGVVSERVQTISYGEERPLCIEQDETCWTKSRRAHFVASEY